MQPRRTVLVIIALVLSGAAPAQKVWPPPNQSTLPHQLLIPGHYASNDLPAKAEGTWYALTISGSQVSLVPTTVRLQRAANPRRTGDLSQPGAIVTASTKDSVLFLIRGGHWQRRDGVRTFFLGKGRLAPKESLALGAAVSKDWLIAATDAKPRRGSGTEAWFDINLRHRETGAIQAFGAYEFPSSPEIRWVGDLDGDHRPDVFIYDNTSEAGAVSWALYLSSVARKGDLVGKAAEFWLPGC